jgi:hypothetical protein
LDANAEMFALSAKKLVLENDQMSSIKITGLIDMKLLYKINSAVERIHSFWQEHSQEGVMTAQQMFNGLSAMYSGISE